MPGFSIPGVAGIRQSGANLGSQAGRIAEGTAARLGNIKLQTANARANAITGRAGAFANALRQVGATAQQFPIIKQQREDRALRRQGFQQSNEIRGMLLEKAKADKLELEISSLVASEGLTDPTAVAARFKELGHPEYGDRYTKQVADLTTAVLNMETAERNKWLADHRVVAQIVLPYVNRKEWDSPEQKRAAYQEVVSKAAPFGLDANRLGSEPIPITDDILATALQMGLSVTEQIKLNAKPTLKERLSEEGAAMDHISRVFSRITNDRIWQQELRHSERLLPPEQFSRIPSAYSPEAVTIVKSLGKQPTVGTGRTIDLPGPDGKLHTYQFNPQTQEYDKDLGLSARGGDPSMVNLRKREADLRERAIALEERKFQRGGASPADARRATTIILSMARLLIEGDPRKYRKNTEAATADARAWYDKIIEELAPERRPGQANPAGLDIF